MTVVLIARLVLAGVFAVAGVAKLADRKGTRKAVVAFGAPERIAGALAIALPLVELAIAGLLLPASTAAVGALGALALLGIFSGAIAVSLARGNAPDCHCFGQLHSAPASWKTLARNGALLALAIVALVGSVIDEPPSAVAWIGGLAGAQLLSLVVVAVAIAVLAVGAVAFMSLMRSYGQVLTRLDRVEAALAGAGLELETALELPEIGLAPGTPVPFFAARAVGGEEVSQATLAESGLPALLLFTSPHCGPCATLMPTVAEWQREHADRLSIVIASSGSPDEARAEADELQLANVLLDRDNRLHELFEANGTPSAVLIAPDGTIASWVASGSDWIAQLVGQALETRQGEEQGLPLGTDAPALELPALDGKTVSLADLRGRDSVLLFWNPDCGFCRDMHEDIVAWEASANGVHPRLVVVSSGTEEGTRAEGFRSPVLLDEQFAAGEAFGANGTPMAVLVDSEGRIASSVVAGAEAVFELANARVPV
jgi:thiol-disulfide isomerase/thioredoxin